MAQRKSNGSDKTPTKPVPENPTALPQWLLEESDSLREMLEWWKTRESASMDASQRRPIFVGKTRNTGIRVNEQILDRAMDKAKQEKLKTGGNLSQLALQRDLRFSAKLESGSMPVSWVTTVESSTTGAVKHQPTDIGPQTNPASCKFRCRDMLIGKSTLKPPSRIATVTSPWYVYYFGLSTGSFLVSTHTAGSVSASKVGRFF